MRAIGAIENDDAHAALWPIFDDLKSSTPQLVSGALTPYSLG